MARYTTAQRCEFLLHDGVSFNCTTTWCNDALLYDSVRYGWREFLLYDSVMSYCMTVWCTDNVTFRCMTVWCTDNVTFYCTTMWRPTVQRCDVRTMWLSTVRRAWHPTVRRRDVRWRCQMSFWKTSVQKWVCTPHNCKPLFSRQNSGARVSGFPYFPSSNSPTLARIQLPIGTTYLFTGLIECVFHHLQDVPQVMQVGHMELNPSGQEALDFKLP